MRLVSILALVLLGLAGCAPSEIVLRDPRSGQTAQCHGDGSSSWNPQATEDCARAYEAVGWVRVPQD
jgi:hypothetical protein